MPRNQWLVKGDADEEHPRTELTPMLAGHGMDVEPVYILPSNPVTQACIEGRCVQVWHVKQDNVRQPVEAALTDFLRNQALQIDVLEHGVRHPPGRDYRTVMFSWVDASVGTAKRILGIVGENIYASVNGPKPR